MQCWSVMLNGLARLREIDNRQHHENEGLQRNYKDVEERPDNAENDLGADTEPAPGADQRAKARRQGQKRDQQEDHLAGVEVAEKSQRERNGFRQSFHDAENQVERKEP